MTHSAGSMRRWGYITAAVALGTGGAVLLLVGLNLAAMLANLVTFSPVLHLPPHPTVGHPMRPVPNRNRLAAAPSDHPRFHVGVDGWRQDGPEGARLVLFGGSAAFGFYADDSDTIAHALGAFNAAQMGYALRDELVAFRELLEAGRPMTTVIFYDGANERGHAEPLHASRVDGPFAIMDYGADAIAAAYASYGSIIDVERLPLMILARRIVGRLSPGRRPTTTGSPDARVVHRHAEAAAEVYAFTQTMIRAMAHAADVRAVFVLQPLAACLDQPAPNVVYPVPPVDRVYYRALYRAIHQRTRIDLDLCDQADPARFRTPIHLDGDGNRRVAQRLTQHVTSHR